MRARSHALTIGLVLAFATVGIPYAFACTPIRPVPDIVVSPLSAVSSTVPSSDIASNANLTLTLSQNGTPVTNNDTISLPAGTPVTFSYSYTPLDNPHTPMFGVYIPDGSNFQTEAKLYNVYLELWSGPVMSSESASAPLEQDDISGATAGTATFTVPSSGYYTITVVITGSFTDPAAVCAEDGDPNPSDCEYESPLADYNEYLSTPSSLTCSFLDWSLPPAVGAVSFSVSTKPKASSVLFIPGTEASRLYMKTATGERQVWEPDFRTDLKYLAMNADGSSEYPLYTKDIMDSLESHNAVESTYEKLFNKEDIDVYGGFETFMNGLVANGTIPSWQPFPYDWRYSPLDVVKNGTETEEPDGSVQDVYLENVLKEMASSSPSGKVTIIAHSNGGLVAKALLDLHPELASLVDHVIFVSVPQWGTPEAIGALLHADTFASLSGFVMNHEEARVVTDAAPDAYDLLPSAAYFSHIATPIVTFTGNAAPAKTYATRYGAALASPSALNAFLEDGANFDSGDGTNLREPVPLPSARINAAKADHDILDAPLPSDVNLTAIAGWGRDTIDSYVYSTGYGAGCETGSRFSTPVTCGILPYLSHAPVTTQDGDGTVVSPSSIGSGGDQLYFNTVKFNENGGGIYSHQNLLSAEPIQNEITDLVTDNSNTLPNYLSTTKPTNGANPILQISSHSPINLLITDINGNQAGVVALPGTDFAAKKEDITGSSVFALDDEEYINVPQSGTYSVSAIGTGSGVATLDIVKEDANGAITASTTFSNIPVATSTKITFTTSLATTTTPQVDEDGNGTVDFSAISNATSTSPLSYVTYMENAVKTLSLSREVERTILGQLDIISKTLSKPEKQRDRGNGKGDHNMKKNIFSFFGNRKDKNNRDRDGRNVQTQLAKTELDTLEKTIEMESYRFKLPGHFGGFASKSALTSEQETLLLGMIDTLRGLL